MYEHFTFIIIINLILTTNLVVRIAFILKFQKKKMTLRKKLLKEFVQNHMAGRSRGQIPSKAMDLGSSNDYSILH